MLKGSVYRNLGLGIAVWFFLQAGCASFNLKPYSRNKQERPFYIDIYNTKPRNEISELELTAIEEVFSEDEKTCFGISDEFRKAEFEWTTPAYVSLLSKYEKLESRIIDNLEGKNRDSEGKYGLIPELDGQI